MESTKVNMYLSQYRDKVPSDKVMVLKNALTNASDDCEDNLAVVKLTNPIVILLMSIFLGGLGVDRFMLGDAGLGICKLLIGWLTFGIWGLVDIFLCYKKAKEKNLQELLMALK